MMVTRRKAKKRRVNATGRSEGHTGRFSRLPQGVQFGNACQSLSPNARSLLLELISIYNGENNGSLYLSMRDAAARMGVADLTAASREFDDLQALGFIEMTVDSAFRGGSSSTSRARCWRLAFGNGPGRKLATHDYCDKEPAPGTPERKRMERGLRSLKTYRKARDRNQYPVLDSETLGDFSPPGGGKQYGNPIPP
ncbi:hypothetical protein [Altererythrobacter sp. Z27]|uniref:hypothetical protein n=1 Tax=Altererythrobacter sp. Z27 TaxID=3461147 RepID=UPI0040443DB3